MNRRSAWSFFTTPQSSFDRWTPPTAYSFLRARAKRQTSYNNSPTGKSATNHLSTGWSEVISPKKAVLLTVNVKRLFSHKIYRQGWVELPSANKCALRLLSIIFDVVDRVGLSSISSGTRTNLPSTFHAPGSVQGLGKPLVRWLHERH
jgi:hypothetical protein